MAENKLYYGDNLTVLRERDYIRDESVDLVYLDPPFKSNQDYNVLFTEKDGTRSAAQIQAFEDTWQWDESAARACEEVIEGGGSVGRAMMAFRQLLGGNQGSDMLAYLAMMAPRLIELRRVLKPTGSLYLHCDQAANSYLRILLDAIFDPGNFRNEILWYYYNKIHDRRKKLFPKATDTLLFYVKDVRSDFVFHQLKERREKPVRQLLRKKVDGKMVNRKDAHGHVMYREATDRTIDNVWRIPCLQPAAPETLGYPTQKPKALLDRIIRASSNEGDVVLDPFCGCGTAVEVAQKLNRKWIGIDITYLAIGLIKRRLADAFGDAVSYEVIGEPTTIGEAKKLADQDKYQFQWWALDLVNARPANPAERKKGADRGIDGRLLFHDDSSGDTRQVILSVKGGSVGSDDVQVLRATVDRECAQIGVLISLHESTKPMRREAADAGFWKSEWREKPYPKIQLLTVEELLTGAAIDMPPVKQVSTTFRTAPTESEAPFRTPVRPTKKKPARESRVAEDHPLFKKRPKPGDGSN